ncbi:hypothetical protein AAG570_000585 [Ranatra chinensis]|uniref:Uncharacterized protein n=1 Tax=Ranatra chinensis TaxID=642074 RepID=A0ABD0YXG4_9HEMI
MWWYLIGAVCALAGYIVWETLARCKDLPPGPWGLPVVGYLPWLDPASPHLSLTRLAERYGPVYSVKLGGIFVVVLADARTIRQTLAKDAFAGRADLFVTHGIMGGYGECDTYYGYICCFTNIFYKNNTL